MRKLRDLLAKMATQVELAEKIARTAHYFQTEATTGDPYIKHIERVVALVYGDETKAVAWLHDVLEDTPLAPSDLVAMGIARQIIAAVLLLSRAPGYPYQTYIEDIRKSGNALALAVKRADLQDHLRPNCPTSLVPRYQTALALLDGAAPRT